MFALHGKLNNNLGLGDCADAIVTSERTITPRKIGRPIRFMGILPFEKTAGTDCTIGVSNSHRRGYVIAMSNGSNFFELKMGNATIPGKTFFVYRRLGDDRLGMALAPLQLPVIECSGDRPALPFAWARRNDPVTCYSINAMPPAARSSGARGLLQDMTATPHTA